MKNIELELRAEIKPENYNATLLKLNQLGTLISSTKRVSVMFFSEVEGNEIDIRIRITNGKSEIVIKRGNYESHNRIEVLQDLQKDQFIGMEKL